MNTMRHRALALLIAALAIGPCSAATVPAAFVGTHVHDIGAGAALPPPAFPSIRLWDARVVWPNLEPARGQWQFDRLDNAVKQLTDAGREILLPLALSPAWASSQPAEPSAYAPGNAAPPARLADWEEYVRTVATRYRGRIHVFEMWNEPNKARFFSGDVRSLVDLTCATRRVLKEVDSTNRLVSPAATTQLEGAQWLDRFLAAGGAACVDIVGFHFYTLAHEPPEAALALIDAVRGAMNRQGAGDKPLWDTEFGWYIANLNVPPATRYRVLDQTTAGAFLSRAFILQAGAGVERAFYYAWNNRFMGAVEPDSGRPKPFAAALTVVAQWLAGARVDACTARGGVWQCTYSGARGRGRFVWADSTTSADMALQQARGRVVETLGGPSTDVAAALARGEPVLVLD